jgi:predicted RNase H-like HicB family nuclease
VEIVTCKVTLLENVPFTLHIEKLPEGAYLATSNDLSGFLAQGNTIEETMEFAQDVAEKLIESYAGEMLADIRELQGLLREHGQEFWVEWLAKDHGKIAGSDTNGLKHLLSAFGGMGSLNDLVVVGTTGDVERVNSRMQELRDSIYRVGTMLLRVLERA